MPPKAIDIDDLSDEDKRQAIELLDGLSDLDGQLAEAAEAVKELRAARKKHYEKLMAFVEDCKTGEPPLMK